MRKDETALRGALKFYSTRPASFISHWTDTYDPRNAAKGRLVRMPFILFPRQIEFIQFLHTCLKTECAGLIEKSRDMGATWCACGFSVWAWRFIDGSSIGWGSRKAQLVDRIGDMDSIFEKLRSMINHLPKEFLPAGWDGAMHSMKIFNPENGASITGESGDDIGRGGRKLIYFKDESAHYEHPEAIEAALADNTNIQIDISSVHGLGNVFHRRREAGIEWEPGEPMDKARTQVFIMDWRDHPDKSDNWYEARRKKAEDDGLLHVFAQEVDRNYAASVEGTIIPHEWVVAAIDAHIKLKLPQMESGAWAAALDVADEGGDTNAFSKRRGVVLKSISEWGAPDTGNTTRRVVDEVGTSLPIEVDYDCIGVGAGVKAESNRLEAEGVLPPGLKFIPWNAGAACQWPEARVIETEEGNDDENSPLNKDFFYNMKAQGWWELRRRFEKTFKYVTQGVIYPVDQLISISSMIPPRLLRQLEKELSQPTMGRSVGRLKLLVNKKPPGTKSPNLADSVMMCYFPVHDPYAYDTSMRWVA